MLECFAVLAVQISPCVQFDFERAAPARPFFTAKFPHDLVGPFIRLDRRIYDRTAEALVKEVADR